MSLLKSIMEAQGGDVLKQLAGQFNLAPDQAGKAMGSLMPALTAGMKKNIATEDGVTGLMKALQGGKHQRYIDNPSEIVGQAAIDDGNGILGHVLGSKDASRQVASEAAQKTGIDVGILKKMLPMVAAMTMGGMSKETGSGGAGGALGGALGSMLGGGSQAKSGAAGMLGKLLDSDGDGSVMDDVMGFAKKLM